MPDREAVTERAVEELAKRRHEARHRVDGDIPPWDEILDPWRSTLLRIAREDLAAILPLLQEERPDLRDLLVSDAAVHALYSHAPNLDSDNDSGPTAQEESALIDALEAVGEAVFAATQQPDPPEHCPACGSPDRFVLRPTCALDSHEPHPWHRGRRADPPKHREHNRIPDDFWIEGPCGHPPDPVAAWGSEDRPVCHCGRFLDPADALEEQPPDAPGPIVPCNGCGCAVAIPPRPELDPPEHVGDGEGWPPVDIWRWHCGGELQLGEVPDPADAEDLGFDVQRYVPASELDRVRAERDAAEQKAFDQHVMVGEAHTQLEVERQKLAEVRAEVGRELVAEIEKEIKDWPRDSPAGDYQLGFDAGASEVTKVIYAFFDRGNSTQLLEGLEAEVERLRERAAERRDEASRRKRFDEGRACLVLGGLLDEQADRLQALIDKHKAVKEGS